MKRLGTGNRGVDGTPGRRRVPLVGAGVVGCALVVALVCWITLTPSPVDRGREELVAQVLGFLHGAGAPEWFGYAQLEFSANIAMFVPVGLCIGLLLSRRVWIGGLAAAGFSVLVELVQFLALPERYASVLDVLANTLGGWIGIGLAVLVRRWISARDRRLVVAALGGNDAAGSPLQDQASSEWAPTESIPTAPSPAEPVLAGKA